MPEFKGEFPAGPVIGLHVLEVEVGVSGLQAEVWVCGHLAAAGWQGAVKPLVGYRPDLPGMAQGVPKGRSLGAKPIQGAYQTGNCPLVQQHGTIAMATHLFFRHGQAAAAAAVPALVQLFAPSAADRR